MDVRGIAVFAVNSPDTWVMMSAGYPEDILAQINKEIDKIHEEKKYEEVGNQLPDSVSFNDVKKFAQTAESAATMLTNLKPMEERTFRQSKRTESRVTFELTTGDMLDLRVYKKMQDSTPLD